MPTQRTCGATMLDRFNSTFLKFRFLKFRFLKFRFLKFRRLRLPCLRFTSACVRHREIRLQQG